MFYDWYNSDKNDELIRQNMRPIYPLNLMVIFIFFINSNVYAFDDLALMAEEAQNQIVEYQDELLGQPDQLQDEQLFKIENQENSLSDTEMSTERNDIFFEQDQLQKKLAEQHEHELADYSILTNKFYENERIRVFNYTAYNVQQLKTSLLNPSNDNPASSELYLSFGYGIEFKINALNKVGYEYISSFPYDRGQLLRLFWIRTLTY
ncbi:hypothetical protein KTI63_06310 [Acinetobacter guillouiae]|nr:hypothetical protein [Acinetobacter guillouiae]